MPVYLIFHFLFWSLFKVASIIYFFQFSRLSRLFKNGNNSPEDYTVEHVGVQFFW